MKFALAINAKAGSGRATRISNRIQDELIARGHTAEVLKADSPTAMSSLLEETVQTMTLNGVVAVGGDGLAHLVINACAETQTPMYTVPAGTGNDFARTNNPLLTDANSIVDRLVAERPHAIDLARVTYWRDGEKQSQSFGQVLSTGFDSLVNRRANRLKIIKGQMKYNIATLLELPLFRPINYEIELDGKRIATPAMLVAIANGPTYGGGMKILPVADRHDGLIDVLILKPVSKFELLRVFPRVFKGTHITHPAVEIHRVRSVTLRANALAYADGEYISELPITVEAIPNALHTWEYA
jgi:diacylglycerol kinase (ATP)